MTDRIVVVRRTDLSEGVSVEVRCKNPRQPSESVRLFEIDDRWHAEPAVQRRNTYSAALGALIVTPSTS